MIKARLRRKKTGICWLVPDQSRAVRLFVKCRLQRDSGNPFKDFNHNLPFIAHPESCEGEVRASNDCTDKLVKPHLTHALDAERTHGLVDTVAGLRALLVADVGLVKGVRQALETFALLPETKCDAPRIVEPSSLLRAFGSTLGMAWQIRCMP